MITLLLPFAKRLSDAQMVSPEEVPRGLDCKCVCPSCESPVLARKGTEREWHFAHAKGDACDQAYAVSVHERAKQLIREHKKLLLPPLEASASAMDAYGRHVIERQPIFSSRVVILEECKIAQRRNQVTPDITGLLKGREVLVEVTVFHRLMPEKRERLIKMGLAAFEIDLSVFKSLQATTDRLEHAVFENESNRRWITHPRLAEASRLVHAKLDARLKRAREQFEAEEAMRKTALRFRWPSAPIHDVPQAANGKLWSASLPEREIVSSARKALSVRTGVNLDVLEEMTGTITHRSQLVGVTPDDLARKWAEKLGLPVSELFQYLFEAGYTVA